MGRLKTQGDGTIISVSMYAQHVKMAEVLIEKGYYNKVSEIVRYGIETTYKEKMGTAPIGITNDESPQIGMKELVSEYVNRKRKMTIKGRFKYEIYSKQWLEGNIKLVEKAFPNKSIDEVYIELEEMIKEN